jgi:histidinol-phosphate aminotransferase
MDDICVGNGSNELIDLLCRTFGSRDEHAVFGDPSFVCYWLGCTAADMPFTKVPLRDHVAWDVGALLAAVKPETKLLFVAHPNNPTGAHVPSVDLRRLLTHLPERVIAVVDEAYVEFADAPDYETALAMRDLRERLVVLRTFSKAYGMAGLRVGYAIAPPALVGYLNRVRAPFNVNAIAQAAARAALGDREHVERYVALNRVERGKLSRALPELGVRVAPSQANFVLADFGMPNGNVYDRLLRMGVIIRPMPPPIDTSLRITVGLPEENERLLAAIRELRS